MKRIRSVRVDRCRVKRRRVDTKDTPASSSWEPASDASTPTCRKIVCGKRCGKSAQTGSDLCRKHGCPMIVDGVPCGNGAAASVLPLPRTTTKTVRRSVIFNKRRRLLCAERDCPRQPKFNTLGMSRGLYCSIHKLDGMVDVLSRKCAAPRCNTKSPKFNTPGELRGLYCSIHRLHGMVDVMAPRCAQTECSVAYPKFNVPGESRGLYCAQHKLDGMVNVLNRECAEPRCNTQPIFNAPGESRGLYCAQHKLDGMVNVVSRKCADLRCNVTHPKFNAPGESRGLYCAQHKLDGMVNVLNRQCAEPRCNSRPSFNVPGATRGIYCYTHKLDGMVNVLSQKCTEPKCNLRPIFNMPGKTRGLYCAKHKLDGMVNVVAPRCAQKECNAAYPKFNVPGESRGLYCVRHKNDEMINVVTSRCSMTDVHVLKSGDMCPLAHLRADGVPLCWGCMTAKFPDRMKSKIRKELFILADIQRALPELDTADVIVWDCRVPGGCSLKRPDNLFKFDSFFLDFEVDENGHADRTCADEDARIELIAVDVGFPGIVLRINPDKPKCMYQVTLPKNGEKVWRANCFFPVLIERAVAAIHQYIKKPPDEIVRLFVDASASNDPNWTPGTDRLESWGI